MTTKYRARVVLGNGPIDCLVYVSDHPFEGVTINAWEAAQLLNIRPAADVLIRETPRFRASNKQWKEMLAVLQPPQTEVCVFVNHGGVLVPCVSVHHDAGFEGRCSWQGAEVVTESGYRVNLAGVGLHLSLDWRRESFCVCRGKVSTVEPA